MSSFPVFAAASSEPLLQASQRWSSFADTASLWGMVLVLVAGIVHGRAALRGSPPGRVASVVGRAPFAVLLATLVAMLVSVWFRGIEVNHFPSQTMSEVLNVFTTALLLSILVLHFWLGLTRRGPGWMVLDDVLIGLVLAGVFFTHRYVGTLSTAQRDLPPALQSYWFPPHLMCLIFSYATLSIAALIGLSWFLMRFWFGVYSIDWGARVRALVHRLPVVLAGVLVAAVLAWMFSLFGSALTELVRESPVGAIIGLGVAVLLLHQSWRFLRTRPLLLILTGLVVIPFVHLITVPLLLLSGLVLLVPALMRRTPSPARLSVIEREFDEVSFRAFSIGFPFLTAGVWMGAFWAQEAWANYWGWDSKENSALITWLVYVLYVHLRMLGGYRGSKAMAVLVGGALSVFLTFQIFGYLPDSQKSLHRYTDDAVVPMEGQQGRAPEPTEQARAGESGDTQDRAQAQGGG